MNARIDSAIIAQLSGDPDCSTDRADREEECANQPETALRTQRRHRCALHGWRDRTTPEPGTWQYA